MPVADMRELEERRRALALEVENMRREREQRSGQSSVGTPVAGRNADTGADVPHTAVDCSMHEASPLDRLKVQRSTFDWHSQDRGMSSASSAAAPASPERRTIDRPRFDRPLPDFCGLDRSGTLAVSSTKAPDAEVSTTLSPASATGIFTQTGSSFQASSFGGPLTGNHSSILTDTGSCRNSGMAGSESSAARRSPSGAAISRDAEHSCSSSGQPSSTTDAARPQVSRLGHADLIARARAVGRETADAIERAKAPLERSKSATAQWPPHFASTGPAAHDSEPWRANEVGPTSCRNSNGASRHCIEAQPMPRPPMSPRPTAAVHRTHSPQKLTSPRAQSPRPDLHWGATSMNQPARHREMTWSPRSSVAAYPPSPEEYELPQRVDRPCSIGPLSGDRIRSELLREMSRDPSPLPSPLSRRRPPDTTSRPWSRPPSPPQLPAPGLSEHYRLQHEDASSIRIGGDRFSPRRGAADSLLNGADGWAYRGQEGAPASLAGRASLLPSGVDRSVERTSAASVAPPPLPQLLSASSLGTSSLWASSAPGWSKAGSSLPNGRSGDDVKGSPTRYKP